MAGYNILHLKNIRNRAYVVDNQWNKIFYGTDYQCRKFIEYMKEGVDHAESGNSGAVQRKDCVQMEQK